MSTLMEKLPLPERRGELLDACCQLLDQEVSRKGGLGGMAVKAGYKVLKAIKPGAVREAVDSLFDEFVTALDPLHAEYEKIRGNGSLGTFLRARTPAAAEALLGVTDRRAERSRHRTLRSFYLKLRPAALRHVQEAVPGLGGLMDRYYEA